MEPISWTSILFFILSSVSGGIIGNRADEGFTQAWSSGTTSLASHISKGDRYVNDELEKAVRQSFLRALQSITSDSLEQLTGGFKKYRGVYVCDPENRQDVVWLEQHLKLIDKQVSQVENNSLTSFPLGSVEQIDLLVTPRERLDETIIENAKQNLINLATQEIDAPELYQQIVEESLFERLCLFFAYEIKSNSVARNIFQTQLLAKVNQILEGQSLTLENMQSLLLEDIPSSLSHLGCIPVWA
ncbi:MAG: hypothetical protein WBA57_23795 [Elainellaceae cyanobacterium]